MADILTLRWTNDQVQIVLGPGVGHFETSADSRSLSGRCDRLIEFESAVNILKGNLDTLLLTVRESGKLK